MTEKQSAYEVRVLLHAGSEQEALGVMDAMLRQVPLGRLVRTSLHKESVSDDEAS